MTKRIDVATLPVITGTLYPSPFDEPCRARQRTRLADAAGLRPQKRRCLSSRFRPTRIGASEQGVRLHQNRRMRCFSYVQTVSAATRISRQNLAKRESALSSAPFVLRVRSQY